MTADFVFTDSEMITYEKLPEGTKEVINAIMYGKRAHGKVTSFIGEAKVAMDSLTVSARAAQASVYQFAIVAQIAIIKIKRQKQVNALVSRQRQRRGK